jgi:hypothetical protein
LEELKHNIEKTFVNIDPETLRSFALNTLKMVDVCFREDGGIFQRVL